MRPLLRIFAIGTFAFGVGEAGSAPAEEAVFRNKLSLHNSALAAQAEFAIKRRLETEGGEEEIATRRYFTDDIDHDGKGDLLLVTDFTNAVGNYWSHDFLLIRSSAPDKPIFKKFGGKDERSYKSISLSERGISVDFLYYAKTDASCCPSIEKEGFFILEDDELAEVKEFPPLPKNADPTLSFEGTYTVKGGESAASIARHFGLTVAELATANPETRFDQLHGGSLIQIKRPK